MIILGAEGEEEETMKANALALILLCLQPVLLAGGMIANRKMKQNHPFTLPIYTALVLLIMSIIGIVAIEKGFDFSYALELSWGTWGLFALAGLFTIFENATKFLAFRYHEAAPLQKLAFLPNVWSFSVDAIILSKSFAVFQVIGFSILFTFYSYELTDSLFLKNSSK